jgi:hypothetical protein
LISPAGSHHPQKLTAQPGADIMIDRQIDYRFQRDLAD